MSQIKKICSITMAIAVCLLVLAGNPQPSQAQEVDPACDVNGTWKTISGSELTLRRTETDSTQIVGSYKKNERTTNDVSGEASLTSTEVFNPFNPSEKYGDACPLAFVVRWPSNDEEPIEYKETVMTYTGRHTVPVNGGAPRIRTVINAVSPRQDDLRSVAVSKTTFFCLRDDSPCKIDK